jgi:hypothetical protein
MSKLRITDDEVEVLANMCTAITRAMCKSLSTHGVPVTAGVIKAISSSITTSLIADRLSSLNPINKLH